MRIDTLSLMPELFDQYFGSTIFGRAQKKKVLTVTNHNLRDWGRGRYHQVDDTPYGGGPGMVLRIDVVNAALKKVYPRKNKSTRVILLTPRGATFDQRVAARLSKCTRLIVIAGRFEAVDARIDHFIDEKISLGNFVLSGGELAAASVIDAVARLVPGVVGKEESIKDESFSVFTDDETFIEYQQFTKPETYKKFSVPKILLSGNHAAIAKWRDEHRDRRSLK